MRFGFETLGKRARFHRFAQPGALLGGRHMIELVAGNPTIDGAQARDRGRGIRGAVRHRTPDHRSGQRFEIAFTESVVLRFQLRRTRWGRTERVEARGEVPSDAVAASLGEIDRRLARAAQLVHSASADPGLIASAIEAVPADMWGAELDELRTIALDLGKQLRSIEAQNPDLQD